MPSKLGIPSRPAKGFTLLEVIVALTITGFVLGSLFSLVAGSKQLSWRSQDSLVRAINSRAQINFSLLENEYNEVDYILENQRYETQAIEILEAPERQTQPTVYALEEFEVVDNDRDQVISGIRMLQQELPQ